MGVKEGGQLANVMDNPIPKKEIAQNVKRDMTKMVGWAQARKREAVNLSHRAPLPEKFNFRDIDLRNGLVPETKVQLN